MKKKQMMAAILTAAMGISLLGSAAVSAAVTVPNTIDGETVDVTYDKVPERVVSLAGFATEMLMALGLEDKIVGYGYMDNAISPAYEEAFAKLENLADGNPSQEVLLGVEPDFLTGWASTFSDKNFPQSFCADNDIMTYVPQVETPPATMESVYTDFENLGEIFQVQDRASEIVTDMKDRVAAVQEAVKDEEPVTVFIYDSGEDAPFTASAGLPTDMINLAGGKNIFEGTEKNWMSVDWESVIDADPEYIIVMDYLASDPLQTKLDFLQNNEALADLTAVKNGNIFEIGLTDMTGCYLSVDAIEKMAAKFHPTCFE
ncbi:MAG: ABC transporter substrate-binding protein [Eubacteriales bacterium]|nr:ABC transporter substrate-binding protein [Eubacteriales bacterium]